MNKAPSSSVALMTSTSRPYFVSIITWAILVLSALLGTAYIHWGLPALWHPDEIVELSLRMAKNNDLNPQFFAYPSLQIYFSYFLTVFPLSLIDSKHFFESISSWVGFPADITSLSYLLSRLLTAMMATLTVWFTIQIATRIFNTTIGLLSGFFLCISAGFINLSHFATVDIPLCFWLSVSFYCCLRAVEQKNISSTVLAALMIGFTTATKYNGVLSILTLFLVILMNTYNIFIQKKSNSQKNIYLYTYIFKHSFVATFFFGAAFLIATPYAVLDFPHFIAEFVELNFYQNAYSGTVGVSNYSYLAHIKNLAEIFSIPLAAVSFIGFFYLSYLAIISKNKALILLIFSTLVIYLKMGAMAFHPPRYILPVAGFLVIGAAKMLFDIYQYSSQTWQKRLVLLVMILISANALLFSMQGLFEMKNDDRNLAKRWVIENIPATATLEMTPIYGVDVPKEYTGLSILPHYHQKETFQRMFFNEKYQTMKRLLPNAEWSKESIVVIQPEPEKVSLLALETRKPDYLILTARWHDRFLSEKANAKVHFPKQYALYTELLAEKTAYKIVADFRKQTKESFTPQWDFIHSGVVILKRTSSH